MGDIAELEQRLTAALDRIAAGLESGSDDGMAEALAAERAANAQLEERVRAIKERQETQVAALQDEVGRLRAVVEETDADLRRMRGVNAELRASNTALREANAAGLADAGLVNAALQAELDALRALQDGDRAEIDRALDWLEPMLKEAG
jgi:hypothetical protein